MNRTYLYLKWLCSLGLLLSAITMKGQTGLEYWFDNYSEPKLIGMPTAGGTLTSNINVSYLSQGFHTIYFRIQSNGDTYSPISSSTFFKISGDGNSYIEYWFEDEVDKLGKTIIDVESDSLQILDLDLSDVDKFPLGVHQLNMRVAAYGGFYSPLYSTLILRLPNGSGDSVLEYWFDDEISKRTTYPVDIEKGEVQSLDLDLTDAVNFPTGFHKLNMRIASNGNQYSPIYSAYVMKLPVGEKTQLTYWLDDDYKNRNVLSTIYLDRELSPLFLTYLDFSSVSSGMHRLHFRVSENDIDDGVIYETPIMVTRRYNNDEKVNVTIQKEDYWVDEIMHLPYEFYGKSVVTREYTLNPSNYTVGQHAFHVQYMNSAQVWSEQNVTYFYKEATGKLRVGRIDTEDGIDDVESYSQISYNNGTIFVECQSPKLASTGIIAVYDLTGKVIARQEVNNSNGIYAELDVNGCAKQMLIVKFICGGVHLTKKIIAQH